MSTVCWASVAFLAILSIAAFMFVLSSCRLAGEMDDKMHIQEGDK